MLARRSSRLSTRASQSYQHSSTSPLPTRPPAGTKTPTLPTSRPVSPSRPWTSSTRSRPRRTNGQFSSDCWTSSRTTLVSPGSRRTSAGTWARTTRSGSGWGPRVGSTTSNCSCLTTKRRTRTGWLDSRPSTRFLADITRINYMQSIPVDLSSKSSYNMLNRLDLFYYSIVCFAFYLVTFYFIFWALCLCLVAGLSGRRKNYLVHIRGFKDRSEREHNHFVFYRPNSVSCNIFAFGIMRPFHNISVVSRFALHHSYHR